MSCYGCACDHCAYNAELGIWDFTPGEVQDAAEICFCCDECKNYDGDHQKRSQWRESCDKQKLSEKYIRRKREADARAAECLAMKCRAAFRVIEGGGQVGDSNELDNPENRLKLI